MSENSKAVRTGSVIALIAFILSFVPYLILLGFGIYAAVDGFTFFSQTSYGMDAFLTTVFFFTYLFYPVPLFCLVYQICWLIRRKHKTIPLKKYIRNCAIVYAVLLAIVCVIGVPWLDMI
ncbi:MAG: hypothetical protein IJZ47_07190 [Oscillospiraceae bacterium]|nr:hypothetical protein [Oscillospiraceae bacterium]